MWVGSFVLKMSAPLGSFGLTQVGVADLLDAQVGTNRYRCITMQITFVFTVFLFVLIVAKIRCSGFCFISIQLKLVEFFFSSSGAIMNDCELCGRRHNIAHRCPVIRFDGSSWVHSDDASSWPVPVPVHELTAFDVVCPHCRARSWREEHVNCCGGGRLQLPFDDDVPLELAEVILSAHVRQHIRRYECHNGICDA
jgi:hypothetical protein